MGKMEQILKLSEIMPYENNARKNDKAVKDVAESIKQCGYIAPIIVDENNVILAGHTRYKALKKLGYKEVTVRKVTGLTEEQKRKYRLLDNKTNELAEWDFEKLKDEIDGLDFSEFDIDWGLEKDTETISVIEDAPIEIDNTREPVTKLGDIWQLGEHRLICGDSTDALNINILMQGKKADLVFTDPPYGMKKEKDGVANDNLNYDDLLEFNKQWIPLTFDALKDNGSWYCWGIDEPLMDIYSEILKPLKRGDKEHRITFRNLITWDKGNGQGQLSEDFRMYPIADEKCLFVMKGEQGFNTNADNYFEGWEPIRDYLLQSRLAMNWSVPTMKKIVGHSEISFDHWTGKSQFNLPTEKVYNTLKQKAERQRQEKGIDNDAFKREYDDIKREYDDIKREYDDIKREYYATRAYFDNTHDNMNNVWHFSKTSGEEKETAGGHATPKPIALCSRAIKSSSREGEIVLDVFGGSGSTLIACEQLNRKAYLMELEPKWCDVIIKRWENFTGKKAIKLK